MCYFRVTRSSTELTKFLETLLLKTRFFASGLRQGQESQYILKIFFSVNSQKLNDLILCNRRIFLKLGPEVHDKTDKIDWKDGTPT